MRMMFKGIVRKVRGDVAVVQLSIGKRFWWPAAGLRFGERVLVSWNYEANKPQGVFTHRSLEDLDEDVEVVPTPVDWPTPSEYWLQLEQV